MSNISPHVVLSYGRSGSVFLVEKLGRATQTLPSYVTRFAHLGKSPVQHCHLVLEESQTAGFTRIFNLRRDPEQTLLSNILSDHYRVFHQFKDQSFEFESFVFDKWPKLYHFKQQYIAWHRHYAKQLNSNDTVIFYEDMVAQLTDADATYSPLYKNKRQLISNYDELVYRMSRYTKSLQESQQSFVQHKNQSDIYAMLNQ
jgi:hypothetical protein